MGKYMVHCPGCGTKYEITEDRQGEVVRCATCKHTFRIGRLGPKQPPRAPSRPPVRAPSVPRGEPAPPRPPAAPAPVREELAPRMAPSPEPKMAREAYPWETPLALVAKAQAYDARGIARSFLCQGREILNTVPKDEAVAPGTKAELRVFPDIVSVTVRPLGCLGQLLGLPALILAGPIGCLMAIPVWILKIVFFPVTLLIALIQKARLEYIAMRIRRNPKSSYAIKKMYQLGEGQPRLWQRGEVVQLVRADVRRFLCGSRSLLLFVLDNPMARKPGCLEGIISRFIARRRIVFIWFDKGQAEAEAAANQASPVLGAPVVRAYYKRSKLVLA